MVLKCLPEQPPQSAASLQPVSNRRLRLAIILFYGNYHISQIMQYTNFSTFSHADKVK